MDDQMSIPDAAAAAREASTFSSWTHPPGAVRRPLLGPSDVVDGWRVRAHLSSGGSSDVYVVEGILNGTPRQLALKVVPLDGLPGIGEAVLREAHALSVFQHPYLVHALDIWLTSRDSELEGAMLILLPCAELSLADYLRGQVAGEYEPGDEQDACGAAAGIASALAYLHGERKPDGSGPVVHNDVKPENILQIGGTWLLSDLGIAAPPGDGLSARAGSLSYLAPEYLADHPTRKHPPGDIWALGVVLHQWLTGRFPFAGDSPSERAQAVREGSPPEVALTEPRGGAIIAAMLSPRPEDRPSAAEVARALRALAGGRATRAMRWNARIRRGPAIGAIALFALGGLAGAAIHAGVAPTKTLTQYASYGTARSLEPGQTVPILAQPSPSARVIGRLADGAPVGIACTEHGGEVHGNWGMTSLWDRVADNTGAIGWISDGLLYTGTNSAVAPACHEQ